MDATVNTQNPLIARLCFGTTPKIDCSNYTINSIWLSEQQAAQMYNFGRKHERYLAAMQYKIREDYRVSSIIRQGRVRAYFKGRAYIKFIRKNHVRSYYRVALIIGKTR